ncbi:hypothetical protein GCM10027070_10410 [Barrientosiimonas humi]
MRRSITVLLFICPFLHVSRRWDGAMSPPDPSTDKTYASPARLHQFPREVSRGSTKKPPAEKAEGLSRGGQLTG